MTGTGSTDAISIQWLPAFKARAKSRRIPVSATLELTSRCNLRCRHCYLGNQDEQHSKRAQERDTAAVKRSLDEWAAAGLLYLLITGGDPMMRKDFADVYRHARELGMLVTVFCDGILVTDRILDLFKELPPRRVEISIYGATAETYETITRVPGSHALAWRGIRRLHDAGITVALKTVLMSLNQHEFEAMEQQAADLGVSFRYDAAIFPCLPNGSQEPLDLRVSPEQVVARDMATPEKKQRWKERVLRAADAPDSEFVYSCGAGATGFYADPFGNLSPCLLTTHYRYEQGDRPFVDVWQNDLGALRNKRKTRDDNAFSGCLRGVCTHCPAVNFLETGDEEVESSYMKATALKRYEAAMDEQD